MSAGPSPGDERGPGVRELLLGNEQSEKHLEIGNRGMWKEGFVQNQTKWFWRLVWGWCQSCLRAVKMIGMLTMTHHHWGSLYGTKKQWTSVIFLEKLPLVMLIFKSPHSNPVDLYMQTKELAQSGPGILDVATRTTSFLETKVVKITFSYNL